MNETSPVEPIEPKWPRRLRRAFEAVLFVLGVVLLVVLSFTELLAWAKSPQGLNQSVFFAWLIVLLLAIAPVAMLLQAGDAWRRGYRAPKAVIAAWAFVALGVAVQWAAGAPWAEVAFRPVVLGVMFWFQRPIDPPQVPVENGSEDGSVS
jgi:hypothetical protein